MNLESSPRCMDCMHCGSFITLRAAVSQRVMPRRAVLPGTVVSCWNSIRYSGFIYPLANATIPSIAILPGMVKRLAIR